ncbi:AMP-dependent synthetase/ligase [Penicillium angulare]|uniref:AMP-dependent synthetase/ligase n=1 Tax=Penicillium angulare TaxID=116970 RepID=UPI002540AC1A|nr:AMP-dependent synthetase/ligase [Penicillium angulare]KAJ5256728.1 AMP-dependent synthetase/ligase [Penicillium angulare]
MVPNIAKSCFLERPPAAKMIEAQNDDLSSKVINFTMSRTSKDILNMLKGNAKFADEVENQDLKTQWVIQLAWLITIYKFSTSPTMYFFGDYSNERPFATGEERNDFKTSDLTVQLHIDSQDTLQGMLSDIIHKRKAASISTGTNENHRWRYRKAIYNTHVIYQTDEKSKNTSVLSGYTNSSYSQTRNGMISNERLQLEFPVSASRLQISYASEGNITVQAHLTMNELPAPLAKRLFHHFDKALSTICDMPIQPVGAIDLMTPYDYNWITELTQSISPTKHGLLHEMCLAHAKSHPNAPAVRSWDGDFNYQELKDLVHRLTHWLVDQGVGPGIFVACVFYKSAWAIVARLAVLMAGGAYVCVDAHDPPAYLASVLKRTRITILLSSFGFSKDFHDQVEVCFEVSATSIQALPFKAGVPCSNVTSNDPCVVLFTSGSTGTPKGIIQEHRSYASALVDYIRVMKMDSHSRMFQFDAYAFDISNNDYLAPLIAGGCCCVPTTSLSMEALMTDFMDLQANVMFVTPSVAIDIDPDRIPTLETICIGGELISDAVLSKWLCRVRVVNQYGMGEVASMCAYNPSLRIGQGAVIGRPATGAIWIVNADNADQLMPVGAVGELLIEGPHVARGYLDGVSGQSGNFLDTPPPWMTQIHLHRELNRLYRSGDLGRYNDDGSIELIGRKDSMLKLDGARIEADQVEYILSRELSKADTVIVDVLGTIDGFSDPILVVFLFLGNNPLNLTDIPVENMQFSPVKSCHAVYSLTRGLIDALQKNLPSHYIPSLFLLIDCIPRTKSKKTDRRKLHMLGQNYYLAHREELREITVWPHWE